MPSFKAVVGFLFALLIIAIAVLGLISFRYNDEVIDSSSWINHTHQVIKVADEVSSAFKDIQMESNAIYIKGDTSRAAEYRRARAQLIVLGGEIKTLTGDNDTQRPEIDSLERLVPVLISFTDSSFVNLNTVSKPRGVDKRFDVANNFRDQVNLILGKIKAREAGLLKNRQAKNDENIKLFNRAFSQLLVGIAVLIVVAFFSIRYNFNKLLRIDEQLRMAQEKTERSLATEIETNKLKSNFVALASHEFRTPLTTIFSSASLLENYSVGENRNKALKHIARIKSSVNSLTSILNEFLSLTKIEEGKVVPNFEKLDLKHYLEGCISNLQNFTKPGQTIIYAHGGINEVETDPVFIGNIINNLVTNAIKYSPENSTIYVSSHANDSIHLSVQDNGIGIPEEDQKHLFERFYRASNAGTVHGTGLGLHIMKHYVDMLNGTVHIKSHVGKGTSVEIILNSPKKNNNDQ